MYRKRLKTVYELLEAGNNKKVIQEVDKLVASTSVASNNVSVTAKQKKQTHQQLQSNDGPVYDEHSVLVIAKALKSLALVRTGRKPDGDRLIDELLNLNITDENALSIVMQYCKETQQLFKIVSFYENAVAKCQTDPNLVGTHEHEEMMSSLFNAHLRNRDFLKQQQVALKLYKQTNKMMFCFWNAASYVMMAKQESIQITPQQRAMYMQLGEKILQKAYEDQKMEYNGEFLLYLSILEERNKYIEALGIVEAFDEVLNGSKLGLTDFKVKKKMLYLKHLMRWKDLRKVCELHLANASNANLDDWLTYLNYLDVVMELYNEAKSKEFIEEILQFFQLLINRIETKKDNNVASQADETKQSSKAQGPYLVRIEFLVRLVNSANNKDAAEAANNYIDLFKSFFESFLTMFACKPGFFYDLIYFRDIIQKLNLSEFILSVLKKLHDQHRPFKTIKSIYTCLSYWQMDRFFGRQKLLNQEESLQLASDFEDMYKEALQFGKDLVSTSFQYADEFLILAVHIRYDMYKKNPSTNSILQLIINLKHGLLHSPSNYQLKLLLLNLYSHLGAYESIQIMYDSMEIKNIQNYSTANLLLIHNIRLGAIGQSNGSYMSMVQFFTSSLFDMANFMVYCFKYGTFLKAIEIYSFMNTICKSLTLNMCLTNYMCASFIMYPLATTPGLPIESNNPNADETELILKEFRSLQTKIDFHLKEISNVSGVFDVENGLLPDDEAKLTELLLDHNDKNVLYNWEPEEEETLAKNQYKLVMDEQRQLLRLRNIMIRFADIFLKEWVSAAESDRPGNQQASKFDLYKSKLENFDFKSIISDDSKLDYQKCYVTQSNYLSRWPQLYLDQVLFTFVSLSSDLSQNEKFLDNELANQQETLIKYRDSFIRNSNALKSKIEQMVNDLKENYQIENVANLLECFAASLECLSYVIILLTASLSSQQMRPLWSEKMKKSKKKKGPYAQYSVCIDIVYEIFDDLFKLVCFYSNELKQTICPNILSLTQALFSSQQSTIKIVNTNTSASYLNDIAQSYSKSFEEIRANFNSKLKFMSKFAGNSAILSQMIEGLKF